MSKVRWTFEYRIIQDKHDTTVWMPRPDAWKTRTGAVRNADKLQFDMESEGLIVETRVGHIEIVPNANGKGTHGRFVPEGVV